MVDPKAHQYSSETPPDTGNALHGSDSFSPDQPVPAGESRALRLLSAVQESQEGLPGPAALAWERTAFRAVFLIPEPGRRIRAFLTGARPEE